MNAVYEPLEVQEAKASAEPVVADDAIIKFTSPPGTSPTETSKYCRKVFTTEPRLVRSISLR